MNRLSKICGFALAFTASTLAQAAPVTVTDGGESYTIELVEGTFNDEDLRENRIKTTPRYTGDEFNAGPATDFLNLLDQNDYNTLLQGGFSQDNGAHLVYTIQGDPLGADSINVRFSLSGTTIGEEFGGNETRNFIVLTSSSSANNGLSAVPLPASVLFLGAGLGGFGLMGRLRRREMVA